MGLFSKKEEEWSWGKLFDLFGIEEEDGKPGFIGEIKRLSEDTSRMKAESILNIVTKVNEQEKIHKIAWYDEPGTPKRLYISFYKKRIYSFACHEIVFDDKESKTVMSKLAEKAGAEIEIFGSLQILNMKKFS